MAANSLILLSLLTGIFQCAAFFYQIVGRSPYPIVAAFGASAGYWFLIKSKGIAPGSKPNAYLHFVFTTLAYVYFFCVVPFLCLMYLFAIPVWMRWVGVERLSAA